MDNELKLIDQDYYSTGILLEKEGNEEYVLFYQSYPNFYTVVKSERVMIRKEDIPKIIKFLQQIK